MAASLSRGIFILLLYLQNICGQQGLNSNGGAAQQPGTKTCLIQNPGFTLNIPQQGNIQINPQQTYASASSPQTNRFQPQLTVQNNPENSNQLSDIFSALHNIRLYQTSNVNPAKSGCSKQNTDQSTILSLTNQPNVNQVVSQTDPSKLQPSFTFRFVPITPQSEQLQNSQYYLAPPTSQQANYVSQPTATNVPSPQTSTVQSSPLIPVSSSQMNPVQSQPIVLALQSHQSYSDIPVLSSQLLAQTPVMYRMQLPTTNEANSKLQTSNNFPGDGQSMMSLLMSQLQSPSSNQNPLPATLPEPLNGKQEKSSGMKAILPLLLNILNEKRSCGYNQCGCGCPNQEPTIHSGYSSQKNYSQKEKLQRLKKESNDTKNINKKNYKSKDSEEGSDEDEEYDDDDDDEDGYEE